MAGRTSQKGIGPLAMNDLIDTTEMYLRIIYELEEEGTPPLRARIAERLSQSGPTVSQTVARMERDGLLRVATDRRIELSDAGHERAARVMRKHRLAECMLMDLLKLNPEHVHEEACRWEHVMSDEVERRMLELLGNPTKSPFGNPIPALSELDLPDSPAELPEGTTDLASWADGEVRPAVVQRIDETAQSTAAAMGAFQEAGVQAGAVVECQRQQDRIWIGTADGRAELDDDIARHVLVLPQE